MSHEGFRLVSYNILGSKLLSRETTSQFAVRMKSIGRALNNGYDIVLLQECWPDAQASLLPSEGFPYVAFGAGFGPKKSLLFKSGLVILSRFPIVARSSLTFRNRLGFERFARKGALWVKISVPYNNEIGVTNTHLASAVEGFQALLFSDEMAADVRFSQLRELDRFVGRRRTDLLAGDFNTVFPAEEHILSNFGIDATTLSVEHLPPEPTFFPRITALPTRELKTPQRFDRIILRDLIRIEVYSMKSLSLGLSDHEPVEVFFRVRGN